MHGRAFFSLILTVMPLAWKCCAKGLLHLILGFAKPSEVGARDVPVHQNHNPPLALASLCRYLHKPYLIGGRKFDLRIYVYVTCYDPLRVYLFQDGLVRFASCK